MTMPLLPSRGPSSFIVLLATAMVAASLGAAPPRDLLDPDTAAHVAGRTSFGATPDLVRRIQTRGLAAWLDEQLRPEASPDAALDARLARLPTLAMTPRTLAETYFIPAQERRRAAAARTGEEAAPIGEPMRMEAPGPERAVVVELATQKLMRATSAERQVEELLVDFWFNHFNVFAGKGPVRLYVHDFERTAIRPHVLGSFRDMLGAVAGSPAMLFYLDNWQSSAPGTRTRRGPMGLNENYARELLELHTLGVEGGYTQQDVVEVARAFTGWTIREPRRGGEAVFDPRRHDTGRKTVLGQALAPGGRDEGERVLDMLARHPATARHLARKLAVRFVSDTPSDALVARVAARFMATGGNLRETTRALLESPEFLAPAARRTKIKTPLEFVTSALRVLDADVRMAGPLAQQLRALGMPPYFAEPPTGYSDQAGAWTNGGALVQRMNVAVALTAGRLRGVGPPRLPEVDGDTAEARAMAMAEALLLRAPSPATMATMARARTPEEMAALLIGSPDFQRR
ncbi:hypothetical protein TBR22_A50590 [Luteitalea sp. TBR-22]|nr:hypothetical protein TBR22_A50590 [Luteitalea sp. TBR-22]